MSVFAEITSSRMATAPQLLFPFPRGKGLGVRLQECCRTGALLSLCHPERSLRSRRTPDSDLVRRFGSMRTPSDALLSSCHPERSEGSRCPPSSPLPSGEVDASPRVSGEGCSHTTGYRCCPHPSDDINVVGRPLPKGEANPGSFDSADSAQD